MNPMEFLPYFNYQQRTEELIKQAVNYRLLVQASKTEQPAKRTIPKILAFIAREVSALGFSLEVRYGGQSEIPTTLSQQNNPGGCS